MNGFLDFVLDFLDFVLDFLDFVLDFLVLRSWFSWFSWISWILSWISWFRDLGFLGFDFLVSWFRFLGFLVSCCLALGVCVLSWLGFDVVFLWLLGPLVSWFLGFLV